MSRFLMVMWSGGGAVPPQLAVAKRLLRAGHDVSILAPRSLADTVTGSGATFQPYQRAPEHDLSDPDRDLLRDWEARGLSAPARMRDNVMFGTAAALYDDVLELMATGPPPDVLVTDYVLLGSYLAAERTRTPLAALLHTIYTLPRPGVPPFGPGLQPARHFTGKMRDALLRKLQLRFHNARLDDLNQLRRDRGLSPLANVVDLIAGADRLLILTSPAFDYPGPVADNARWIGAITDPDRPSGATTDRPDSMGNSVLVSFSTTYQQQVPILARVITALAGLPVQAIVTCGPAVRTSELPDPPNVRVIASMPHDELLPTTDLVITHGGHGTVTTALRHGVPVLCVPMGRDQRDIAARLVWHGAGVRASTKSSVKHLRRLIDDALTDPSLRSAAERLASQMADDDHDLAVHELEALASSTGPSTRSQQDHRGAAAPRRTGSNHC